MYVSGSTLVPREEFPMAHIPPWGALALSISDREAFKLPVLHGCCVFGMWEIWDKACMGQPHESQWIPKPRGTRRITVCFLGTKKFNSIGFWMNYAEGEGNVRFLQTFGCCSLRAGHGPSAVHCLGLLWAVCCQEPWLQRRWLSSRFVAYFPKAT